MFNENDVYSHLMKGGSPEDLYKALENEIHNAQDRIIKEKDAELKQKDLAEKINKARASAFKALKSYFALVNPDITEDIINSVLDTLESVKIQINNIGDRRDDEIYFTDAEIERIWNIWFPFNSKRK